MSEEGLAVPDSYTAAADVDTDTDMKQEIEGKCLM